MTACRRVATDLLGKRYYTLLADKQNPWPTIESDYPAGRVFSGQITNVVEGKGAWVPVFRDINGHLPADEARRAGLRRGDEVEVVVAYVDVSTRKVGLHLAAGRPTRCRSAASGVRWLRCRERCLEGLRPALARRL